MGVDGCGWVWMGVDGINIVVHVVASSLTPPVRFHTLLQTYIFVTDALILCAYILSMSSPEFNPISHNELKTTPLPCDDSPTPPTSPSFSTCTTRNKQIEKYAATSTQIKSRIHNYKKLFNIVEEAQLVNVQSTPCAVIKTTYNKESILSLDNYISTLDISRNVFFHILDASIFSAHATITMYNNDIFPIILHKSNIGIHEQSNIPVVTDLIHCLYRNNIHIESFECIRDIEYTYTMHPNLFILKYAMANNIISLTSDDVTTILEIIENQYTISLPETSLPVVMEEIKKYITDYFLHTTLSSILTYNIEQISRLATFSITMIYIQLLNKFFFLSDTKIYNLLVAPFVKMLNPNHPPAVSYLFDTLHETLYEKSTHQNYLFEIVHTCYKKS